MSDTIDQALVNQWLAMRDDSERASAFYFERILPQVVRRVEELPEHTLLRKRGCSTLVSLMGLSPETTVIAATVLRPSRLVIVASDASSSYLDRAIAFLTARGIMAPGAIRPEDVVPTDIEQIYEAIRRYFRGDADGAAIMDVTGGKKIMSATAAVAAWELRMPLCYVEGDYQPSIRRPMPGTERVILLSNPSRIQAGLLRKRAIQWYDRGSMPTAIEAFRDSRNAQTVGQHLDELALQLASCEAALMDLDFKSLQQQLKGLDEMMRRSNIAAVADALHLAPHLRALERVATREPIAVLGTFRQLVTRYAAQERFDFACLLAYRTLEELVQIGLSRASRTRTFDVSAPDLALLTDNVFRLRQDYAATCSQLGFSQTDIPGKLGFLAGLTVLVLSTDLVSRLRSGNDRVKVLKHAAGLAAMRNGSVLAHGFRNLTALDVERLCAFERDLARAILSNESEDLEQLEKDLAPPSLQPLPP